jgi:glycosyltransferase involved in cell wall biosynthesis
LPDNLNNSEVEVSIVVPFYNPGPHFRDHLIALMHTVASCCRNFEIIAVNDGSTEDYFLGDDLLSEPQFKLIEFNTRLGKGAALKAGFKEASGKYIGFIDADGDIPAYQIQNFITAAINKNSDAIVGSKYLQESKIEAAIFRKLFSRIYRSLIKMLFKLPVDDTQTGIKIFKRDAVLKVISYSVQNGFVFDVEILWLLKKTGFTDIQELPVVTIKRQNSTIKVTTLFEILKDTFKLRFNLKNYNLDS